MFQRNYRQHSWIFKVLFCRKQVPLSPALRAAPQLRRGLNRGVLLGLDLQCSAVPADP